jgi:hypothetical protein
LIKKPSKEQVNSNTTLFKINLGKSQQVANHGKSAHVKNISTFIYLLSLVHTGAACSKSGQ